MKVRDIMTQNVITVQENNSLGRAAELMRQYNIGILPVVSDRKVLGVITDRDIVTRAVAKGKDISLLKVSDCMSKSTVFANPEQEIDSAVKTMAAQQIRRVPVMDEGRLCGIVSLGDISKNGFDAEVSRALCEISKP